MTWKRRISLQIVNNLKGLTLSITGGTGSFGKTMLKHALKSGVEEIRIISRDEEKQDALRKSIRDERVKYLICDVRDLRDTRLAIEGSNLVFHAAALKQVPTGEFFPMQVVKTNIQGSNNVMQVSIETGVSKLICLSTDKAVNPINAMGMSKALMEKVALSYARENKSLGTAISVTRYGNVMCSRGSVIPRFMEQISKSLPITITNPDMTRFLMSLDEAIELVLYAFQNSEPGDVLVKKAPGATVENLALAVAKFMNIEKPEMKIIGTRHGEKMHESLLSAEERAVAKDLGGYFRVPVDLRTMDYEPYFNEGSIKGSEPLSFTSKNTTQLDVDQILQKLFDNNEAQEILRSIG